MSLGLIFWILMLLWLIFGWALYYGRVGTYGPVGSTLLLFILLSHRGCRR